VASEPGRDKLTVFAACDHPGNLLSHETGVATAFAIEKAQARGQFFVGVGDDVYANQIVGINAWSKRPSWGKGISGHHGLLRLRSKA